MPRVISSAQTFLSKFIIPMVVALALTFALRGMGSSPIHIALLGFLGWTLYWYLGRLKKVTLEPDGLLISNYFREIRVPFKRIAEVKGSRWVNTRQITVTFDYDVGFGTSIVFMPKVRFLWPGQEHPIAQELRDLIRRPEGDDIIPGR